MPEDVLLSVRNLVKEFPVRGGVFSRTVARVQAVDRRVVRRDAEARRSASSASPAAASRPPVGCSCACSIRRRARSAFDGRDLAALGAGDLREVRQRLQIVFQDPYASLNPRMTVESAIGESRSRSTAA